MDNEYDFHTWVRICDVVRTKSQIDPSKSTAELIQEVIDSFITVEVYLYNDKHFLPSLFDTMVFWDRESAEYYVEGYNNEHGWQYENVDYLIAKIL